MSQGGDDEGGIGKVNCCRNYCPGLKYVISKGILAEMTFCFDATNKEDDETVEDDGNNLPGYFAEADTKYANFFIGRAPEHIYEFQAYKYIGEEPVQFVYPPIPEYREVKVIDPTNETLFTLQVNDNWEDMMLSSEVYDSDIFRIEVKVDGEDGYTAMDTLAVDWFLNDGDQEEVSFDIVLYGADTDGQYDNDLFVTVHDIKWKVDSEGTRMVINLNEMLSSIRTDPAQSKRKICTLNSNINTNEEQNCYCYRQNFDNSQVSRIGIIINNAESAQIKRLSWKRTDTDVLSEMEDINCSVDEYKQNSIGEVMSAIKGGLEGIEPEKETRLYPDQIETSPYNMMIHSRRVGIEVSRNPLDIFSNSAFSSFIPDYIDDLDKAYVDFVTDYVN